MVDKKRMENGSFIGKDCFEHLLAEIWEIRPSERSFCQKRSDNCLDTVETILEPYFSSPIASISPAMYLPILQYVIETSELR